MSERKDLLTENGHPLLEAVSALQKEIRRGREVAALYWAVEIEGSYPNYLWYRLVTIANEDISLASPQTIVLVNSLKDQYFWLRQQSQQPNESLCLTNAVVALCRSRKTRLADDLQAIIYLKREYEGWKLEPPDYAVDEHTARGRQMGRGVEHWQTEGCVLNPPDTTMVTYRETANALREKYKGKEPGRKGPGGKGGRERVDGTPKLVPQPPTAGDEGDEAES